MSPEQWWVVLDRQYDEPLAVGPYPSPEHAAGALESAPLIDGLCEVDCLDIWVAAGPPDPEHEEFRIELNNPDHFGRR